MLTSPADSVSVLSEPWYVVEQRLRQNNTSASKIDLIERRYDSWVALRILEGIGFSRPEIVVDQKNLSESKLTRLHLHSNIDIDVAGVDELMVKRMHATVTRISRRAAFAERSMRLESLKLDGLRKIGTASQERLDEALDDFNGAIEEAKDTLQVCLDHISRLKMPTDELQRDELSLDLAGIASLEGIIALHSDQPRDVVTHMQEACRLSEPLARKDRVFGGAAFILGRAAANIFNAGHYGSSFRFGSKINSKEDIAPNTALREIIQKVADRSFFALLYLAVKTTTDERLAGNFAQALALAARPDWAADIIRLVLPAHNLTREHLLQWKPPQWTQTVMGELYMNEVMACCIAGAARRIA